VVSWHIKQLATMVKQDRRNFFCLVLEYLVLKSVQRASDQRVFN
jgi:hypothetical protein